MKSISIVISFLFFANSFAMQPDNLKGQTAPKGDKKLLSSGDHFINIMMKKTKRTCLVHIPKSYNPSTPMPLVLIFHGAATNGAMTVTFTGLNSKAEEAGFIAAYPYGTGTGPFLTWNAGVLSQKISDGKPDDVAFINQLLDELLKQFNIDQKKVYATGISNGAMMCYKLASELTHRIAAIAPVAGTMNLNQLKLTRPMPVMHFHGTKDTFVPFDGPNQTTPKFMIFKSAEETALIWAKANQCRLDFKFSEYNPTFEDGTKIKHKIYTNGAKDNKGIPAEVHLIIIEGGGHTWPGTPAMVNFIGTATKNISANDFIWDFFRKYQLP